jgi:hypothetical protein
VYVSEGTDKEREKQPRKRNRVKANIKFITRRKRIENA